MILYVPSFNGDVRFESVEDGNATKVVCHDLTDGESAALMKLLATAREKKWTDMEAFPEAKGMIRKKVTFELKAPLADVGEEYVKLVRPSKSTITALKHSDGSLEVTTGTTGEATKKILETAKEDPDAKAVSAKRPTACCPQCVPGAIEPATECLLDFLSPEQHRDWARHRVIEVEGGLTGHRYLIAHRHSEYAQRWGRIALDADDDSVLHFYDWSHPPEEEVLGAALILRHREDWLRHEATCLGGRFSKVFKNPFGGLMDGRPDAALFSVLGGAVRAIALEDEELPLEVRKALVAGLRKECKVSFAAMNSVSPDPAVKAVMELATTLFNGGSGSFVVPWTAPGGAVLVVNAATGLPITG